MNLSANEIQLGTLTMALEWHIKLETFVEDIIEIIAVDLGAQQ